MKFNHPLSGHHLATTSRGVFIIIATTILLLSVLLSSIVSSTKVRHRPPAARNKRSSQARHPRSPTPQSLEDTVTELAAQDVSPTTAAAAASDGIPPPEDGGDSPESLCGLPLFRLPKRLVPSHYDLMIMPNLSSLAFEGAVQIDLRVRRRTTTRRRSIDGDPDEENEKGQPAANQIVLHADDSLNIDNIWYRDLGAVLSSKKQTKPLLFKKSTNSNESSSSSALQDPIVSSEPTTRTTNYIDVIDTCRDPEYQLLVITLAKNLEPASRGQLYLTFSGPLSEDLRGFYRSNAGASSPPSSSLENDTTNFLNTTTPKYLATTQFQATEARRAFPCFDEPALKATFDVSLVHSVDQISLSNMDPLYERVLPKKGLLAQISGQQRLVKFARSPPMSTYLLAFVVGPLEHIERNIFPSSSGSASLAGTAGLTSSGRRQEPLRIRVYAPSGLSQQGAFALDTACGAYQLLEEYCSIELPMRKLDLVAVADFEAGAMENWGLVIFKDQQLLVDPKNTAPVSRALVGGTVVHELAHHWFGNLVTLKWWNELWLNEGFATWFEHTIMEQLYPELEFQFHYLLDSHIHALNQDSSRFAHPIRLKANLVGDPQEIDELFDAISYNKAAAIIRTLNDDYLKPEPFKLALQQYLRSRKFSTATSEQLCHHMESAVVASTPGRQQRQQQQLQLPPVCRYLNSWLSQAGHPLIELRIDPQNRRLVLSQTRFVTNVVNLTQEESEQRWLILVKLLLSDGGGNRQQEIQIIMGDSPAAAAMVEEEEDSDRLTDETTTSLTLPSWFNLTQNSGHWLKFNANFSGFYRTLYPEDLFKRLREPTRRRLMSPADRLNLVDETHALVLANRMGAEHLIELLSWLADENHGAVLESATSAYLALLRVFENFHNPGLRQKLLDFGRLLFGSMLGRQLPANYFDTQAQNSTHMLEIGRSAVLNLLVQVNHELALLEAVKNFDTLIHRAPAPHLRAPFYTAVARNGSEAQHGRLLAKLDERVDSREELGRLATALAKAEQEHRLARLWSWLRNSANAAAGLPDRLEIVSTMAQSGSVGRQFVRQLLEESPGELIALNQERPVTGLIEELCVSSGSDHFRDLSGLFLRQKNLIDWSSARDSIKRSLDWQARLQAEGAERLEQVLDHYLRELRQQASKS